MRNGGYQVLDFKNISFTSGVAKADTGLKLYDLIEGTRKRIVISGLVVGSKEFQDFEVLFALSGTTFIARHSYTANQIINISITDENVITIALN